MPTTRGRKKQIFNTVAVSLGCGGSRMFRKSKLKFLFNLKPKLNSYQQHPAHYQRRYNSSSSSYCSRGYCCEDSTGSGGGGTTNTFSPTTDDCYNSWDPEKTRKVRGMGESVAVEKESDDPYLDFRQSMLQMILENQLYSKDDLKDLLDCFLQLNSPFHHKIIVMAFTEIWNGVFSVKPLPPDSSGTGTGTGSSSKVHYQHYHRHLPRGFD